jgi:prophage regulatory protein
MTEPLTDSWTKNREAVPQEGLLRIGGVLELIPVSRSHWWQGVKEGKYPQPIKLSERVTVWRASDIRALVEGKK